MAYLDYDGLEYFKGKLDAEIFPAYVTPTASGDIASFPDGADEVPMRRLVANIEPSQDLHGQANPYPGGAGKNLIDKDGYSLEINTGVSQASYIIRNVPVTQGVTYTFSCYQEGSMTSNLRNTLQVDHNGSATYESSAQDYHLSSGYHSVTFTAAVTGTADLAVWGNTLSTKTKYSQFMLEVGSSRTAYAPYANICPISGWTEANGVRTGKNVLQPGTLSTAGGSGATATIDSDGVITINGTVSGGTMFIGYPISIPFGRYTMTGCPSGGGGNSYQAQLRQLALSGVTIASDYGSGATFDYAETGTVYYSIRLADGYTANNLKFYPMIRPYTVQDATFEPFKEILTIPISFPDAAGTVYGGTLNVTSGELTVDRVKDKIKNAGGWDRYEFTGVYLFVGGQGTTGKGIDATPVISSIYKSFDSSDYIASTPNLSVRGRASSYAQMLIRDDRYTDKASFLAAVGEEEICWYLATPQTYQLTPTQVTTLLGTNNVWFDCGSTDCTYRADTKLYIDNQLTQAIANALNA